jgi:peptide/nickel transport system ATP-binding protein
MSALIARALEVRLPGRSDPVLDGVELTIRRGAILAIVGESGAGKTMLLRALCGALPEGAEVRGAIDRGGQGVAAVLAASLAGLSPVRRVGAQIADAARGADPVLQVLARLGLGPEVADRYPQDLSGGMQQRVALARALASGAGVVLVDEPTGALDGPSARLVLEALAGLRAAGRAVAMVTHDPALAAQVADGMVVMHRGRLVESGAATQVLAAPLHPVARAMMAALPARAARLADLPGLPPLLPDLAGPLRQAGRPALHLQGVTRRHRGGSGIVGIDLEVQAGEIVAVCGASGSGKTTLARVAARLDPLDDGEILLDGRPIGRLSPRRFARAPQRRAVQMVFQDAAASFAPRLTVLQSLGLAGAGPLAVLPGLCKAAGLDPGLLNRPPGQLSPGQLARAALVRAVLAGPRFLVLDEPTAMLDASRQADVLHMLEALRRQGAGLLLVTHDLHIARLLADRLAVMDKGRIVEMGPSSRLLSHPAHPATQALVAAMP